MTNNRDNNSNITYLVNELSQYQQGNLPKAALQSAAQHWPEFWLEIKPLMEKFIDDPESISETDGNLLFMGIFLAAQQKEYQAFPLLIALCDRNDDYDSAIEGLLGDALTSLLPSFLYILSEQTPNTGVEPLNQLIISEQSGAYIKSAAVTAIFAFFEENKITRTQLLNYVEQWLTCFSHNNSERNQIILALIANKCLDYDIAEFKEIFLTLANEFKLDPDSISPMELEEWLPMISETIRSGFIKKDFNVITELQTWAAYRTAEQNEALQDEMNQQVMQLLDENLDFFQDGLLEDGFIYNEPYIAPKTIGRNDPCSCGSGKKYKKCCL
ncbi:MAG: DUF1186 domain-containing protein [Colwellia sp.]|nr:DUF1186 domain-containing protein [Colwellia sp.]